MSSIAVNSGIIPRFVGEVLSLLVSKYAIDINDKINYSLHMFFMPSLYFTSTFHMHAKFAIWKAG